MSIRVDRVDHGVDGNRHVAANGDASIRELLRQLADEGSNLVRGEVALAKLELKDSARALALDLVKLVAALALAWVGGLALTACIIIGLGTLLGGAYWLSALIVGVVLLAIGGLMAQRGIAGLKGNSVKPEATLETMEENKRWASREAREFKEGVRSS
jgi:uncharacterized membrane protein YqjE